MPLIPDRTDPSLALLAGVPALLEINRNHTVARALTNAAHDLNNLLQVIGGNAELLATRAQLGPVEMRRVETIAAQTGRAATTLDQLMSYSRPAPAGRQLVALDAIVAEALALRDFSLRRAQITSGVDRKSEACRASVDRRRVLQVLLNILMNAEAALTGRRDGSATVRVVVEVKGSDCVVTVTDNGPGFAPDVLARLTDTTQVGALDANATGLGLLVAARILGEHGGRLEVDNATGGGAVVTVSLPAA